MSLKMKYVKLRSSDLKVFTSSNMSKTQGQYESNKNIYASSLHIYNSREKSSKYFVLYTGKKIFK